MACQKKRKTAQFEGVKSTEKFYSLHSVPLQTMYTGQACFAIFTKCNGVEGGLCGLVAWWGQIPGFSVLLCYSL